METPTRSAVFHPRAAHMDLPGIRRIAWTRPFTWLRLGAWDLARAWPVSLLYGVVFAALAYALVHGAWGRPHLAMALASGFLFVAPVLATVFYDLSRRIEAGEPLGNPFAPLRAWGNNPASLGLFALMLVFALTVWERISAILVGLFLGGSGIGSLSELLSMEVLRAHTDFVATYLAFGSVLALALFSLSVVALPLLLHRKVDFATALVTSLLATRYKFPVLLLWGVLIAGLVALGLATDFVALALLFPWLGHASWHAYRELVASQ